VPTVFWEKGFRFFFTSWDCIERPHVHAERGGALAKYWLEPEVELDDSQGLTRSEARDVNGIVQARREELLGAWWQHCGPRSST
jgi:hypothetical protein